MLDHVENRAAHADDQAQESAAPEPRLPIDSYWLPILGILDEAGGTAPSGDVIDALEDRLGDDLGDPDRKRVRNGEVRWRNRARFARLRMKEQGLLSDNSPRGIWEITDAGRAYLGERSAGQTRASAD